MATGRFPQRSRQWLGQAIFDPLRAGLGLRTMGVLLALAIIAWAITGWWLLQSRSFPLTIFFAIAATVFAKDIIDHPFLEDDQERQHSLRASRFQFPLTAMWIGIAGVLALLWEVDSGDVLRFLQWLVDHLTGLKDLPHYAALAIDVVFAGLYFFSLARRGSQYLDHARQRRRTGLRREVPYLETFARDLVAGTALFGLLALLLRADVYGSLVNLLSRTIASASTTVTPRLVPASVSVTDCTTSWYLNCAAFPQGQLPQDYMWLTISFTNVIVALILFIIGGSILASVEIPRLFAGVATFTQVAFRFLRGIASIPQRLAKTLENVVTLVGTVIWPLLIIGAMVALGYAARNTRSYLELLNCEHSAALFGRVPPDPRCGEWGAQAGWIDNNAWNLHFLGTAAVLIAVAAILILAAVVVQFYCNLNTVEKVRPMIPVWGQQMVKMALVAIFAVGLTSVVLGAADLALVLFQTTGPLAKWDIPHPYWTPGIVTYVALGELLAVGGFELWRRSRGQTRAGG